MSRRVLHTPFKLGVVGIVHLQGVNVEQHIGPRNKIVISMNLQADENSEGSGVSIT